MNLQLMLVQDQEFDVYDRYIDETRNSLFLLNSMVAKPETVRCVRTYHETTLNYFQAPD